MKSKNLLKLILFIITIFPLMYLLFRYLDKALHLIMDDLDLNDELYEDFYDEFNI